MSTHRMLPRLALASALMFSACGQQAPAPAPKGAEGETITNRIDVPARVVESLGITFAKAKYGKLEQRYDVPGRLIVPPGAELLVRAPVAGKIHLPDLAATGAPVAAWARVEAGALVAEIRGPELQELQAGVADVESEAQALAIEAKSLRERKEVLRVLHEAALKRETSAQGRLERARAQVERARGFVTLARERRADIERLAAQGAAAKSNLVDAVKSDVEAEAALADALNAVDTAEADATTLGAETRSAASDMQKAEAELALAEWKHTAAGHRRRTAIRALAETAGVDPASLDTDAGTDPAWARLDAVLLRATRGGVVRRVLVAEGAHVEAGDPVLEIADLSTLWFEGRLPESEADEVRPGAMADIHVVGHTGEPLRVEVRGPHALADEETRTLTVHASIPNAEGHFAAGATAIASVVVGASAGEEVLVPLDAVVRDGLDYVVFVRAQDSPDKVVRLPVSIGRSNREQVEILSDVMEGDELVLDGVHELREASTGRPGATGHFHADGTWHEGDE